MFEDLYDAVSLIFYRWWPKAVETRACRVSRRGKPPSLPAEDRWPKTDGREPAITSQRRTTNDAETVASLMSLKGRLRRRSVRDCYHRSKAPMRKVFHFDSPPEPYIADAVVLSCFDYRIAGVVRKFLRRRGIEKPDMVIVAGGAKTLASPRNDFEQDFILEQVRMSIRLHQAPRVLLTCHSDCATYGGLAFYNGDRAAEAAHHSEELRRAARLVLANFPTVQVERYLLDFEGVWDVPETEPESISKSPLQVPA